MVTIRLGADTKHAAHGKCRYMITSLLRNRQQRPLMGQICDGIYGYRDNRDRDNFVESMVQLLLKSFNMN